IVHAGKKRFPSGKTAGEFDLSDFDRWAQQIGREKFEFLFRISLRTVGSYYVEFLEKLAAPLYWNLRRAGVTPGFEAGAALEYSPYPDPRYRITFDDVFWHLDKESMEETFDRLLDRQSYRGIRSLLDAFFPRNRAAALAAVCEGTDFHAFMTANGAQVLEADEDVAQFQLRGGSGSSGILGVVGFNAYEGRRLRFYQGDQSILAQIYLDFRRCLLAERKKQRPAKWKPW
ncbi:MAG TPA: hypothetical protein VEX43_18740, partial [Chthoniobacterales bacterium]|nr:hypothetical protein [Chthoniobacterales bacterium]